MNLSSKINHARFCFFNILIPLDKPLTLPHFSHMSSPPISFSCFGPQESRLEETPWITRSNLLPYFAGAELDLSVFGLPSSI